MAHAHDTRVSVPTSLRVGWGLAASRSRGWLPPAVGGGGEAEAEALRTAATAAAAAAPARLRRLRLPLRPAPWAVASPPLRPLPAAGSEQERHRGPPDAQPRRRHFLTAPHGREARRPPPRACLTTPPHLHSCPGPAPWRPGLARSRLGRRLDRQASRAPERLRPLAALHNEGCEGATPPTLIFIS